MALNTGTIASRIVVVAEASTPVVKVAKLMRENHIGALVVVEEPARGACRSSMRKVA